jgi:hypothetical protein
MFTPIRSLSSSSLCDLDPIHLFLDDLNTPNQVESSANATLQFEPFDEGFVSRYAALRVRCGISAFVAAVSEAAHAHPVARLGLLVRPRSLVKRRNLRSKRLLLETRFLGFQFLLRDCRNHHRPSESRH